MSEDSLKREVNEDILWGTAEIAAFIGKTVTETQYLIRHKKLPIGRLGPKTLFGSKRQLRKKFTPDEEPALKSA